MIGMRDRFIGTLSQWKDCPSNDICCNHSSTRYMCPMDSDCFYSHEADILSICGVVVPPCVHKQCGGTTLQNPNMKSIKIQTTNPSKSKTNIKKTIGNLKKKSIDILDKHTTTNRNPSKNTKSSDNNY